MLEHLADGCVGEALVTLNRQFRMNKYAFPGYSLSIFREICGLSSSLFYENALECANDEIANRVVDIGSQENLSNKLAENSRI